MTRLAKFLNKRYLGGKMKIGMLWFDNEPTKTLEAKVGEAATYFEGKYGLAPDTCFAHPLASGELGVLQVGGVMVRPTHQVLPNHLWIGVEVKPDA